MGNKTGFTILSLFLINTDAVDKSWLRRDILDDCEAQIRMSNLLHGYLLQNTVAVVNKQCPQAAASPSREFHYATVIM